LVNHRIGGHLTTPNQRDRRVDERRSSITPLLHDVAAIIDQLAALEHDVDEIRAVRASVWSREQRARIDAAKTHLHLARFALQLNVDEIGSGIG
jgi:hypothetical protein